jgi:hypothetical protein
LFPLFEAFEKKLEKDLKEKKVKIIKDEFGMSKIITE